MKPIFIFIDGIFRSDQGEGRDFPFFKGPCHPINIGSSESQNAFIKGVPSFVGIRAFYRILNQAPKLNSDAISLTSLH